MASDDARHAYYGKTMLVLGIEHSIEKLKAEQGEINLSILVLQTELDNIRGTLVSQLEPVPAKRGRPRGKPHRKFKQLEPGKTRSGWSADPEERKAEMARRQAVARRKAAKAGKPASTAQYNANKASWARLTPREKKARVAKMLAGRKAKKELPAVSLVA